jgi:hypothetical protein
MFSPPYAAVTAVAKVAVGIKGDMSRDGYFDLD